jgi:hypothetical protein
MSYAELKDISTNLYYVEDHFKVHIYLIFENEQNEHVVILRHDKKHNKIAPFSGFIKEIETLFETMIRIYDERSHQSIMKIHQLEHYLKNKSILISRNSSKGRHYIIFCNITESKINQKEIKEHFKNKSLFLNNDDISFVKLNHIRHAINENVRIVDSENNKLTIKKTSILPLSWFLNSLEYGTCKNLF